MSRPLLILMAFTLLGAINNCYSQPIPSKSNKQNHSDKHQPKPPTTTPPKPKSKTFSFTVISNEDCSIKINDKNEFTLQHGNKHVIPLSTGTYTLTAISAPGAYQYDTTVTIKEANVSVFIDLAKVISKKLREIRNAEEEAVKTEAEHKLSNSETEEQQQLRARVKAVADTLAANMVLVKGGNFNMGYSLGANDEEPEHMVAIRTLKCSKYEVTQQQWEAVMGVNPSVNQQCATCPVENINIAEIDSFLARIKEYSSKKFRLPTEAEWEYVAKKGADNKTLPDRAWYSGNSNNSTQPVGTVAATELGIFDISGNVAEWCSDWYEKNFYRQKIFDNPVGPASGNKKVVRGGAYDGSENNLRFTRRDKQTAKDKNGKIGFRLVMDTQ